MSKRTLLIDGDIWAYQGAAGAEEVVNWGGDGDDDCLWQVTADERKAQEYVKLSLDELMDTLEATHMEVVLSDGENWRRDVLPTYKSNRSNTRRPIILPHVRAWMREKYSAWQRPTLEGDDLLGILSGLHSRIPGEKVMVTKDKDLSTVPGYHFRSHKSVLGVFEVTKEEADTFHLMQGIAGDPTDGYSGCPGWGMQTAERFLAEPFKLVSETYTPKKGKDAGVDKVRWVKTECDDLWECILSLFEKEGISEADAIVQFQVARILRTHDYDFKKKEPILWNPHAISAGPATRTDVGP